MADTLFAETTVLSVWELTRSIRSLLESEVGTVWVEGEISNFRRQASGHQYFTLKDDRSQLPCVLFRGSNNLLTGAPLADGLHVQAYGDVTVYELRGQYQMIVQMVQPKGVGALQARFEALKRKLDGEGLFDAERKKPLPAFPATVGIVTSPTGAALQDMLNILKRRAPWLRVVVHPVRVQGAGASLEIARAIGEFNAWASESDGVSRAQRPAVDLIVVARGGGSIEDLWEFNEEVVARAIAVSALPVLSAVGHESDFSISDFVAYLRAPTPSAAAELIAPDTADLLRQLAAAGQFFNRQLLQHVERARERLQGTANNALLREPLRRVMEAGQQVDAAEDSLQRQLRNGVQALRSRLYERECCLRVSGPAHLLELRSQELGSIADKLKSLLCCEQDKARARAREAQRLLQVLGPQSTLERGYSIAINPVGEIIRQAAAARLGDTIIVRLHDGDLHTEVTAQSNSG